MAIHRFEDLVAWQRARVLAGRVYACTRVEPFSRDFGLCGQIQRAAVSVMANIAEGFEKQRPAEFGRFLDIAKGSLAEVRSHLYIASDVGYISPQASAELLELVDQTGRVIAGLRRSTQRTPSSGHQSPGTGHPAPGTS